METGKFCRRPPQRLARISRGSLFPRPIVCALALLLSFAAFRGLAGRPPSPLSAFAARFAGLVTLKLSASRLIHLFKEPLPPIRPFNAPGDIASGGGGFRYVTFTPLFTPYVGKERILRLERPPIARFIRRNTALFASQKVLPQFKDPVELQNKRD